MFTGLVETTGRLLACHAADPANPHSPRRLTVQSTGIDAVTIGDSVAINGCCLTVVDFDRRDGGLAMTFEAGEETMSRTNLGSTDIGGRVNLERALRLGDRLGGHYVTGHIDATGQLIERRDEVQEGSDWAFLKFSIPDNYASHVVGKGSIAIDGVSLTVVTAGVDWFDVALIPHTLSATTMGDREVGDTVNLETDVLAKYVEKSIAHQLHRKLS